MKSLVKKLVVLSVAGALMTLNGCCCYKGFIGQNIETMEAYSAVDATIARGFQSAREDIEQ